MAELSPEKRRKVHAALAALPPEATLSFAEAAGAFAPFEPFLAKRSSERAPGVVLPEDVKETWRLCAFDQDVRDFVGEFAAQSLGMLDARGLEESRRVAWRAMSDLLAAPHLSAARWALRGAGEIETAFAAWSETPDAAALDAFERAHSKWARVQPSFAAMMFASAADRLANPADAADLLVRLRDAQRLTGASVKDHAVRATALLSARRGRGAADAFGEALSARLGGRPLSDLFFASLDPWRRTPDQPDAEIDDPSIAAAWAWLYETADEALRAALADADAERQVGDDIAASNTLAPWRAPVGDRLTTAIIDASAPPELRGSAGWAIARLLANAGGLAEILPPSGGQIGELDPGLAIQIRNLVDCETLPAPGEATAFGPLILLGVMRRLRRPAQVLRALSAVLRRRYDMSIDRTDYGVLGHRLIDEAERLAKSFQGALKANAREVDDVAGLLNRLDRYGWIVWGMAEEFDVYKDGPWGKRLYSLKSSAAAELSAMCERCAKAIEAACPRGRTPGRVDAPLLDRAMTDETIARALAGAGFLEGSAMADERCAFATARAKAKRAASERLARQIDDLIEIARDRDHAQRETAAAQAAALVEVAAALEGAAAAGLLRRRLAAAA